MNQAAPRRTGTPGVGGAPPFLHQNSQFPLPLFSVLVLRAGRLSLFPISCILPVSIFLPSHLKLDHWRLPPLSPCRRLLFLEQPLSTPLWRALRSSSPNLGTALHSYLLTGAPCCVSVAAVPSCGSLCAPAVWLEGPLTTPRAYFSSGSLGTLSRFVGPMLNFVSFFEPDVSG